MDRAFQQLIPPDGIPRGLHFFPASLQGPGSWGPSAAPSLAGREANHWQKQESRGHRAETGWLPRGGLGWRTAGVRLRFEDLLRTTPGERLPRWALLGSCRASPLCLRPQQALVQEVSAEGLSKRADAGMQRTPRLWKTREGLSTPASEHLALYQVSEDNRD
ncbi:hypothetical protein CB1_001033039 [Camelus ferus]|nr:hypothetical protein CB1_001033039 [Camelus ferus]